MKLGRDGQAASLITGSAVLSCLYILSFAIAGSLLGPWAREALAQLTQEHTISVAFFATILLLLLLLPFTPTSPVLALGLGVFGGPGLFAIAVPVGICAACSSYAIGRTLPPTGRLGAACRRIQQSEGRFHSVFTAAFVLRAIPHPLYDLVGYACGALRVPFLPYVLGSTAGGSTLVGLFCIAGSATNMAIH